MARRFAKVSEEEIEEAFFYPSDLVNIKTTIPLSVGEEIDTSTLRVSIYIHHYSPSLRGIVVYYPRAPLPLQFAYFKMAEYKHQFVIIYSVDKCFELNKRSLDIRNSENESMKGTMLLVSTRQHGLLVQCIRCGVHRSGNAVHISTCTTTLNIINFWL